MSQRPVAPVGRRVARVIERRETGAYIVIAAFDPGGPLPSAGQFYMLSASNWGSRDGRPFVPRAFSVADAEPADDGTRLDFLLEAVGPGTSCLAGLQAGDELLITGPLGLPFSDPGELVDGAPGAILVGGGIGIAPLALMRRRLVARGFPTRTLIGFRNRDHAGGLELFRCSEVGLASEDGHVGERGYVTLLLEAALAGDDAAAAPVYACGPPAMLEAVRRICADRGVTAELAMEAPMGCGFGACFGCAVPLADGGYMRLCVDGPVVRADRIESAIVAGGGHR